MSGSALARAGRLANSSGLLRRIRYPAVGILGRVAVESGRAADVASMRKVAIIAQYSRSPMMTNSLFNLVCQLSLLGYGCVVVSACETREPLLWPGQLPEGTLVMRRANIGHDFGSWAAVLYSHPEICRREHVILTNDTLIGPFASIDPLIKGFEGADVDVWSLTESWESGSHHLQSFFVGFRRASLDQPSLRAFLHDVRAERSKTSVVQRYEVGLSQTASAVGLQIGAQFRNGVVGIEEGANPTHARDANWLKLLEAGFPFLKRSFLGARSAAELEAIASQVRRIYGVDLREWWPLAEEG